MGDDFKSLRISDTASTVVHPDTGLGYPLSAVLLLYFGSRPVESTCTQK